MNLKNLMGNEEDTRRLYASIVIDNFLDNSEIQAVLDEAGFLQSPLKLWLRSEVYYGEDSELRVRFNSFYNPKENNRKKRATLNLFADNPTAAESVLNHIKQILKERGIFDYGSTTSI